MRVSISLIPNPLKRKYRSFTIGMKGCRKRKTLPKKAIAENTVFGRNVMAKWLASEPRLQGSYPGK